MMFLMFSAQCLLVCELEVPQSVPAVHSVAPGVAADAPIAGFIVTRMGGMMAVEAGHNSRCRPDLGHAAAAKTSRGRRQRFRTLAPA